MKQRKVEENNKMKKVTIILLHYKQEKYVRTAFDSIFEQDYRDIEIIFADDATPGFDAAPLEKYCKEHNKNNVKIIWQLGSKNVGTVKTVNRAMRQASGEYVLLFASDDKLGGRTVISDFVKRFDELPDDVCMVSGQCAMMDKELKKLLFNFVNEEEGKEFNEMSAFGQYKILCKSCFFAMGATCFKKDIILREHLFDERCKYIEDWPAFLRLTERGYRIIYDKDNKALLHRDGGISHTAVTANCPKHVVGFYEDVVKIFLNGIAHNFGKLSKDEKERVYEVFLGNLRVCTQCGGNFNARRIFWFKCRNLRFFGSKKGIFKKKNNDLGAKTEISCCNKESEENNKIKVYFICQYLQGINKFFGVAKKMSEDERFELNFLVFPDDIYNVTDKKYLEEWREKLGDLGGRIIDAKIDDGWFGLKEERPDYVFAQRPYDNYLPESYALRALDSFTKVCYIPYGYFLTDVHEKLGSEEAIRYLSLYFTESKEEYEYAKKVFEKYDDKAREAFNLGYPALYDRIEDLKKGKSAFAKIAKRPFKLIWTPRWTTDAKFQASRFFDFKDEMVNYVEGKNDLELVFRPHPMMFDNFVKNKQMSKKEAKDYLKHFEGTNMIYDKAGDYFATFMDSDVLVTDMSSIVVEYILLGKPIILCDNDKSNFLPTMLEIDEVCYHAKNWREVKKHIEDLKNGKDVLKNKRGEVSRKIIEQNEDHVTEKIIMAIKEDKCKE